jgi:type VI secretion system VasD/TssJ family lipoprotein
VLELKVAAEARFLGVIAGFRDIRNARWKVLSQAPEKGLVDMVRAKRVEIHIGRADVTLGIH